MKNALLFTLLLAYTFNPVKLFAQDYQDLLLLYVDEKFDKLFIQVVPIQDLGSSLH